jgi:Cu(I)/Ag(I) efflux system membrane fusion protein
MNRNLGVAIGGIVLAGAGIAGGYWFAMHRMSGDSPSTSNAASPAEVAGRTPLYWHDPMYPQQKFDKPGKSPFMDMMLVPVYGDAGGDAASVAIDSRVVQNLGVRTAEVKEGTLDPRLEAVGAVAFDERSVAVVQARVNGFVEKLIARAPLDAVSKGQALVEILAPEWVAAQEEFLAIKRSPLAGDSLRNAARQRLVLLGMPEETIAAVERDGRTHARVTLTAPISGVISELGAREGSTITPGAILFRINGLATVWVNAEVPESQAGWLKPGAQVQAAVPAYPGEKFAGRLTAILPEVNAATRTVKARVELANPGGKLKPGMFATVEFIPPQRGRVLLAPSEAVIRTGKRDVVVIADTAQDGRQRFRTVDVEVGAEAGGMTEIRKGLERGTKVVTSGQFLIDSEASLKASGERLEAAPGATGHGGEGHVETREANK